MCSVNGCLTFEIEKAHICKYMPVSNQSQEENGRVFKFFEEITDFILLITSRGHPLPTIFTRRHVHFHIAIRYLDMVKTSLTHSMRGFCFIVFVSSKIHDICNCSQIQLLMLLFLDKPQGWYISLFFAF